MQHLLYKLKQLVILNLRRLHYNIRLKNILKDAISNLIWVVLFSMANQVIQSHLLTV